MKNCPTTGNFTTLIDSDLKRQLVYRVKLLCGIKITKRLLEQTYKNAFLSRCDTSTILALYAYASNLSYLPFTSKKSTAKLF